jgi:DNA excision repair protein ERCC-4
LNTKRIIIDHRENAEVLINVLQKKYNFEIEYKQLKYGDYFIEPDITLERKTTKDFLLSIIDGRLFHQAYRLTELTQRPIILIEGKTCCNTGVNISIESIKGALITLAQTFHIPVLRTIDEKDTAWYIEHLFMQRNRVGKNKGSLLGYTAKRLNTQKINLLRMLPGIGKETAKNLLDHFETITNIINASEKELAKLHGIGKKTANKIKYVVSEELSDYKPDN